MNLSVVFMWTLGQKAFQEGVTSAKLQRNEMAFPFSDPVRGWARLQCRLFESTDRSEPPVQRLARVFS